MKKMIIILCILMTASCATARERVRQVNYVLAMGLIQTDKGVYDWVASPDGTKVLCDDLIDKYGPQMDACAMDAACQAGVETEIVRECDLIVKHFEGEFDQAMLMSYDAVEMVDSTTSSVEAFQKDDATSALSLAVSSIESVLDFLERAGVPIPKALVSAVAAVGAVMGKIGG